LIERTNRGIARVRPEAPGAPWRTKSGKPIGRPRVEMSDLMIDRAAEWYRRIGSWRKVMGALRREGFHAVPSYATIARTVRARTKPGG
jgi:hypothetical protein